MNEGLLSQYSTTTDLGSRAIRFGTGSPVSHSSLYVGDGTRPGHVVLVKISDAIWMQIAVSVVGIAMLTAVAYYRSWSKKVDKPKSPAVPDPGIRP